MNALAQLNYGWFNKRRSRPTQALLKLPEFNLPYLTINRPRRRPKLPRKLAKQQRFIPSPHPYDTDRPEHFTRPIQRPPSPVSNPKDNFHVPEFFPEIPPFRENYPRIPGPKEYQNHEVDVPRIPKVRLIQFN